MQKNNKRVSKYHPFSTEVSLPQLDTSKYKNQETLPDIPWPFYHQFKPDTEGGEEFCSPLLPFPENYTKSNIPAFIKEAFDEKTDIIDEYLKAELSKKNYQVIINEGQLPHSHSRSNCMICYKIISNQEFASPDMTTLTLSSRFGGLSFQVHLNCLQSHHSHIQEAQKMVKDELKTLRYHHNFLKTENQIPSLSDHPAVIGEEQAFSLKVLFYGVSNQKTPFLKLNRDVRQTTRMSWEEDFSLRKMQNFLNFVFDEKEEKKLNPFYEFYNPPQYFIPIDEFRAIVTLYRFENGEKYELETNIKLPLEGSEENEFRYECIRQNHLVKISFVFMITPLERFSPNENFSRTFLENCNYWSQFKRIYALHSLSLFMKTPPGMPNPEDPPTRPKSSSLQSIKSPVKCNSQTLLLADKPKYTGLNPAALNFMVPNFLSPLKNNSPSPQSHNSIASPKISYEDPNYAAAFNNEDSPKSPGFIGDLPPFEEMKGNILAIAKSQNGSRILQKFFVKCSQAELESILLEIRTHISVLMLDTYANYMFQTLIQRCTPQQRLFILHEISSSLVLLACDKKGTHSIQALVSLINCEEEEILVLETIKNDVFSLIMDSQGTHFIQKIVLRFKEERLKMIFDCVFLHFIEISNNSGGVCVLKGIMTKFKDMKTERKTLIALLTKNLDLIIQNPYGNYALQHAIDIYFTERDIDEILDRILPKVLQLSNHKFSSNVIEKCILSTNADYKRKFIKEISQDSIILELMKNKYGNFVLKKCCMVADSMEFELLFQGISKNLCFLQNSQYKTVWKEFISNSMSFNNQNMIKF